MKARDVMTTDVLAVHAETPTQEIARQLVDRGISAAPVVDDHGAPIGMVSEGDLIRFGQTDREIRRDWWLTLLAEGSELHPAFLDHINATRRTARDLMSTSVVTVDEDTDVGDVARLLAKHNIKRVPVLRDGRMVGIVSRADLLRALSGDPRPATPPAPAPPSEKGRLRAALAGLETRLEHVRHTHPATSPKPAADPDDTALAADDFRGLVADFEHKADERKRALQEAEIEQRKRRVETLIDTHLSDADWRALVHKAREAAERGEKEFMLLRFPSQACADAGRAINSIDPNWPASLRGEAAEIYLRWQEDLKPRGFHLTASVLDFPGGMPGDIGLFLLWGK